MVTRRGHAGDRRPWLTASRCIHEIHDTHSSNGDRNIKALTIRNVPPALAEALEREKARRGASLNRTVIELLSQGLGVGVTRSNGLAALAGNWTEEDLREFEQAVAPFGRVDDELWR